MSRTLTAILALSVVAAACTSVPNNDSSDPFAAAATGLCDTVDAAGQPDQARQLFFDTVHQPLHQLADETATADRSIAAQLLEAKQAVEAALDANTSSLGADLDRLADRTHTALITLDRPGIPCRSTP